MIIELENGTKLEVPDGSTPQDIDAVISHVSGQATPAMPEQEKGFFDRVGADLQKRAERGAVNRQLEQSGQQSGFERQLKDIASLGGFVTGDLPSQVLTSAWKSLPEQVTKPIGEFAGNAATAVANTVPFGGSFPIKDVATAYQAQLNQLEQTDPLAASRLRAAGDIGNIALGSIPIKGQSAIGATAKVVGKTADAVGDVAGSTARAVLPKIDEGLAEVGALAAKHKIPVSIDQLSFSKPLKTFQKVSQEIPFSGSGAFREKQMLSFNRALFNTVGSNADRFNQKTMADAFKRVGGEFDDLTKGKTFNLGDDFINSIASQKDEIQSQLGQEAADIFEKEALRVINDFGGNNNVKGEILAAQRSRINKLARGADFSKQQALFDLENILVDSITSGDEGAKAALSEAKRKYKNLIALEPVAAKAKGGFISPSLLNERVQRVYKTAFTRGENAGDIGELAKVGYELLPELGGSDTFQKSALAIGATGGAGAFSPPLAAAAIGGMATNRAAQSLLNRNPALVKQAIKSGLTKLPKEEAKKLLEALK
jgi:hypothetical protein